MNVTVATLNPKQTLWIERCARRLQHLGPLFSHMEAVQLAFDLYRAWPGMQPKDAAEAFMAPERLAA